MHRREYNARMREKLNIGAERGAQWAVMITARGCGYA